MKVKSIAVKHNADAATALRYEANVCVVDEGVEFHQRMAMQDPHAAVHAALSQCVKRASETMRIGISYNVPITL